MARTKAPEFALGVMPIGTGEKPSADVIVDVLDRLHAKHQGYVTEEEILAEAQKSNSPIHSLFIWDDAEAAHRFRKGNAQVMMRSLRVKKGSKMVRAYYKLHDPNHDNRKVYMYVDDAMGRYETRIQVLQAQLMPLRRWASMYGAQLPGLRTTVEKLERKIQAEITAHESAGGAK